MVCSPIGCPTNRSSRTNTEHQASSLAWVLPLNAYELKACLPRDIARGTRSIPRILPVWQPEPSPPPQRNKKLTADTQRRCWLRFRPRLLRSGN